MKNNIGKHKKNNLHAFKALLIVFTIIISYASANNAPRFIHASATAPQPQMSLGDFIKSVPFNPQNTVQCGYPAIGMSQDLGIMYGQEGVSALNDPRMTYDEAVEYYTPLLGPVGAVNKADKMLQNTLANNAIVKLWEINTPPDRITGLVSTTLKTDYGYGIQIKAKESESNLAQRKYYTNNGGDQSGNIAVSTTMDSDKAMLLPSAQADLNGLDAGQYKGKSNEEVLKIQANNPNLKVYDPGASQHNEETAKISGKSPGDIFNTAYTPTGGSLTVAPGVFPVNQLIIGEGTGVGKVFEGSKPTKGMVDPNCAIRKPNDKELEGMGFGAPANNSLSGLGGGGEGTGSGGEGGGGLIAALTEMLPQLMDSISQMAQSGGESGNTAANQSTEQKTDQAKNESSFMTDFSKIIKDALSLTIPEPQLQDVMNSISQSVAKLIKNGIPINNVP